MGQEHVLDLQLVVERSHEPDASRIDGDRRVANVRQQELVLFAQADRRSDDLDFQDG